MTSDTQSKDVGRTIVLLAIASAGPTMLLLDFLIRHFFLGSQPPEVVAFLVSHVTPFAWCVVPFPIAGGILGFRWYPHRFRKSLARWKLDSTITEDVARERADLEALFLTTTLAQLPAILGDLSLILGASVAPALCSTTASVTAVVAIGAFAKRGLR